MTIDILMNGRKEQIEEGKTLNELLKIKNIKKEVVTVELNSEIIDKGKYDITTIKQNDKIDFVYYMGGGWNKQNTEILDLRQEVCPINFVKVKLKLENMKKGILEVLLNDGSCADVVNSIKQEGYKILYSTREKDCYLLGIAAKK